MRGRLNAYIRMIFWLLTACEKVTKSVSYGSVFCKFFVSASHLLYKTVSTKVTRPDEGQYHSNTPEPELTNGNTEHRQP